jgi:endogenous inhibitor of DNA gyrase (YacG/DUF329 family)
MSTPLLCPICRKEVPLDDENAPFCSDRCRIIDLGKWASGDYKIASPIFDPEELDTLEAELARAAELNPTKEWKN